MITELVAITSTIIALVALVISFASWRSERRISRLVQHYSLVSSAEDMIVEHKEFLRFHGIDPTSAVEEYSVSSADLAYLLHSFNAGSVGYLLSGKRRKGPFPEGSYRYNMLKTEATRRAFPLIKRFFDPQNPYIRRCEETILYLGRAGGPGEEKAA